jgi:hypothetical protein
MKLLPRNTDGILNHLEKSAADELSYLESVGAEYFTTAQLIRLKGQWEVKNQLFGQVQQFLMRIAVWSPIWLVAWFVFDWLQWQLLAAICLTLFPISFFIFFIGLLFMRKFFKGKGHLETVGDMIDAELRKRSPSDS